MEKREILVKSRPASLFPVFIAIALVLTGASFVIALVGAMMSR